MPFLKCSVGFLCRKATRWGLERATSYRPYSSGLSKLSCPWDDGRTLKVEINLTLQLDGYAACVRCCGFPVSVVHQRCNGEGHEMAKSGCHRCRQTEWPSRTRLPNTQ